jgi:hypothetical protein
MKDLASSSPRMPSRTGVCMQPMSSRVRAHNTYLHSAGVYLLLIAMNWDVVAEEENRTKLVLFIIHTYIPGE